MLLRTATSADAPRLVEIYVDSWNAGFGDLMPTRELDQALVDRWRRDLQSGDWRLAERDGRVVGFAGTCPSRDPADRSLGELDTIAVDPPVWRSGVGRVLMADAVSRLHQAGYPEAIVWTLADYRPGLLFYQRTGWRLSGETRADGHQVALRRRLL